MKPHYNLADARTMITQLEQHQLDYTCRIMENIITNNKLTKAANNTNQRRL